MAQKFPPRSSSISKKAEEAVDNNGRLDIRRTREADGERNSSRTNGPRPPAVPTVKEEEEVATLHDIADEPQRSTNPPLYDRPDISRNPSSKSQHPTAGISPDTPQRKFSEWSHQNMQPEEAQEKPRNSEDEWQEMPSLAPFDIYDDDGRLIARESVEESGDPSKAPMQYHGLGVAAKGYTRIQVDEDAQSATSMDDNTAYLFKEPVNTLQDEHEELRDVTAQMQTTKKILTDTQRIAYVGIVKLAAAEMRADQLKLERTRGSKKEFDFAVEAASLWSQKMMVRLYRHMELDPAEQIMIEQLAEHNVKASDMTPSLMTSSHIKNPVGPMHDPSMAANDASPKVEVDKETTSPIKKQQAVKTEVLAKDGPAAVATHKSVAVQDDALSSSTSSQEPQATPGKDSSTEEEKDLPPASTGIQTSSSNKSSGKVRAQDEDSSEEDFSEAPEQLPTYKEVESEDDEDSNVPPVQSQLDLLDKRELDIDLRWTILCDLFLVLISDSIYDARSRVLLETVASYLDITRLDVCRFEKRVTEALEMEEEAQKEDWNEAEHMEQRRKRARNRRLALMGIATVGGGLVIGLTAGLMAPLIGAGLAAGFTTIGVTGTSTFLAGAGGAAVIGTIGTATGGTVGIRAANRRTGAVKTFEYRPLHNNKRVNLIVTVAGWMNGKVDDVRLPFSTVDPIMGDIYSLLWEPEMLRSMGDTINILATEALTQGLQQILGSTILITLMAALQAPILLTKLSYLIDNPWSVSLARAEMAGLILADSLIDRNLGARPITLVGFSLGSKVIFSALKELAKKGAVGLVQNVFLFGSPVIASTDEYLKARTIVSGRFVNGYARNDWILGYLFRATSGGIFRVAGLAPVQIPSIENFDATEFVPGHMSYRKAMPRLLREVGWMVENDDFAEIEDPDPDNHEARQRELINEIEEARKELEGQPQRKRFSIFGRKKKMLQKQEWETYDERIKNGTASSSVSDAANGDFIGGLFDIEAITREAAELAAQGIQIKELKSTMPPMKIDRSMLTPPLRTSESSFRPTIATLQSRSTDPLPASARSPPNGCMTDKTERPSTSNDHQIRGRNNDHSSFLNTRTELSDTNPSASSKLAHTRTESDGLAFAEEEVSMSFEPTGYHSWQSERSMPSQELWGNSSRSRSPPNNGGWQNDAEEPSWGRSSESASRNESRLSYEPQTHYKEPSRTPSPAKSPPPLTSTLPSRGFEPSSESSWGHSSGPSEEESSASMGNVWANGDEDEGFGKEGEEVSMTFE